jgi:SM-20-related protein
VSGAPTERIAEALERDGVCVTPQFLASDLTRALAEEARAAFGVGRFHAAGVGRAGAHALDPAIRGDQVLWLEESPSDAQRAYLAQMEALRSAINARLYLGLFDFECHFALYPPGSYYRRHIDRFQQDARRTVSCVFYLNERWDVAWGGALRLYRSAQPGAAFRDVLPEGGTFVCFLSDSVWHEVMPTTRERWSLTGWFLRRT